MNDDILNRIYDKTDGCCHLCHKRLSFKNYGKHGARGAWHVEHSIPKLKGGTNHINNLFAACTTCNFEKSTLSSRAIRARNGLTRAPYSKAAKQSLKNQNTIGSALAVGGIGLALAGPAGGLLGFFLGGIIGNNSSPKR